MAKDFIDPKIGFGPDTKKVDLLNAFAQLEDPRLDTINTNGLLAVVLPEGTRVERVFRIADDLFLLQPDGSLVVLLGGATGNFIIFANGLPLPAARIQDAATQEDEWETLADVRLVSINQILDPGASQKGSGDFEEVEPGDPLEGLDINPLLPPTDYLFKNEEDQRYFGGDDAGGLDPGRVTVELSQDIVLEETDSGLDLIFNDFIEITIGPDGTTEQPSSVVLQVGKLPVGTNATAGSFLDAGDGTLIFSFSGPYSTYLDLVLTFPTDFSSDSRKDFAPGPLAGFIEVTSEFEGIGSLVFPMDVTPEGDALIDISLPDEVPDETDDPILVTPVDLLVPEVTDADGSESIETLRLTVSGLPGGSSLADLGIVPPAGSVATISDDVSTGAATLVVLFEAGSVADIPAAYAALNLTLPADFSTANRSDLNGVATSLPLEFTLYLQTDEDQDPATDTPVDGTVTQSRIVDIGFEHDITLDAPLLLSVEEDNGVPSNADGVDVNLGIEITIDDQDGSETEDPSDPRFAAVVDITFVGLPDGTTVNAGTLTGDSWSGTVAQAEDLILSLPGNYAGAILGNIVVTTPEGSQNVPQTILVTPTPDVEISGKIEETETDDLVIVTLSRFIDVLITDPGETVSEVSMNLPGLPAGTIADDGFGVPVGTFVAAPDGTVTFLFDSADEPTVDPTEVRLVFPADYSTESPAQTVEAELTVITEQAGVPNDPVTDTIPVCIEATGDVETADGTVTLQETDAPVSFKPSDTVLPAVIDIDGSESIIGVSAVFNTLPSGTLVSYNNGSSFVALPAPTLNFFGTLAEYQDLVIQFPADFSTANPASEIFALISAVSDEGGFANGRLDVDIDFELDVDLAAPASLSAAEDSDGGDGSGVTFDLGITVAATDMDGSEDSTTVEIVYTNLPDGAVFSTGSFALATSTWTGSMAEASTLTVKMPADYSGTVTSVITALSPEGTVDVPQTLTVTPTSDIEFDITELVTAETDAPVTVTPEDFWKVAVVESGPGPAYEVLDSVTLTLNILPPGVVASGVPAGTITYDPVAGGTLVFAGTPAEYTALQLTFPTDYSTESPAADGLTITGTLAATSTDDPTGQSDGVELRITPEGDGDIDDSLPDTIADETDAPIPFSPSGLLFPELTDADGSESIETLVLTITGLPGGSTLANLGVTPITGVTATVSDDPANGSATLVATFASGSVADIPAAYAAFALTLPADFSTANRSDLNTGATTFPITVTLDLQTDEDRDPATDTPTDGTATLSRLVDIDFEHDITLTAPATLNAEEDDGVPNSDIGVDVDLGIDVIIDDQDGSETEDPADARFAAVVDITFSGLPAGTIVNGGTLTGQTWTGTAPEAEALVLSLPGNYSGTILSQVTVTTPEGSQITNQTLTVTPTPDVEISGEVLEDETDLPVEVLLSRFIDVAITDPSEVLEQLLFNLPGLPNGVQAIDGLGNPVGSLTPDGPGTVAFSFDSTAEATDPADVRLVFPTDYSSVNPATTLTATLTITTSQGGIFNPPVTEDIPLTIEAEGDVTVADGAIAKDETDDVVLITPALTILPAATDLDTSESVTEVRVVFDSLPAGTRFSTDGGTSFNSAQPTLDFVGTLTEYQNLVIELPKDFSTESPATTLTATISAITDEGGFDSGTLTVTVDAEGDLTVTEHGPIVLDENDAPGDSDEDTTTQDPVIFALTDTIEAVPSDADNSESIDRVDFSIEGLPPLTQFSTDGGTTFNTVPTLPDFSTTFTINEYNGLQFNLPDDFSTTTDITGSVTFTTDEAILAGETGPPPNDGIETKNFSVTVNPEGDVRITAADITVIEDLGVLIPLNLDAVVTDIDGSETINTITVTFEDLPTGDTTLSDTTVLNGPTDTWTGTITELRALGIQSFPEHFSGIIPITVTVVTNESGAAGVSETFDLNVTPVAEPTMDLSVDDSEADVEQIGTDNFIVKEDSSFLLDIVAETPDQDGSEELTTIVIENMPSGWVADTGGVVDPALFEEGAADIASATVSGTTLTITLNAGVTSFDGALRVTPLADDDRDVDTILANDLVATVTAVDTAAGLADNTLTASDGVDVDVDAVVDAVSFDVEDLSTNENINGKKKISVGLSNVALSDSDGSETFTSLTLMTTVATESVGFDASDDSQLELFVNDSSLRGFVDISAPAGDATTVTYTLTPAAGATTAQFTDAIADLVFRVPQHFSGILTNDGTLDWSETTTGDVETDTSDNPAQDTFQTVLTIKPKSEAQLDASVFVLSNTEVADDSPTAVTASAKDNSVSGDEILTLLESTDDLSGPGQVELFVGLDASTPDVDGSEQFSTLKIENVPTGWIAHALTGGDIGQDGFRSLDGTTALSAAEWAKVDSAVYDATFGLVTLNFVDDVESFEASLLLLPDLYEDYDVDRENSDPFSAVGDFFGQDLLIRLDTLDDNSATTKEQAADATFDVDVDPVNNFAIILNIPTGNEQEIDDAGGVWQAAFTPEIKDTDGSEDVTAVVLNRVPDSISVYVPDPSDPTGPKIPALITELNNPPGFNSWSLENDQWEGLEFRGIPTHYAGDIVLSVSVVTTESDGGGTRVTDLSNTVRIAPVVDGGTPTGNADTNEDTAVKVTLNANIIDNDSNSPESPERILEAVRITNVIPDSQGRIPRFFVGEPEPDPSNPGDYLNEKVLNLGELYLTPAEAAELWVLPGQDSNEEFFFDVTVTYYEVLSPFTQVITGTGTVTIDVLGVADIPTLEAQTPDPTLDPDSTFTDAEIDDVFRPTEVVDGVANHDRVYGYAGLDSGLFKLNQQLLDSVITDGNFTVDPLFQAADPIEGNMTEITFPPSNNFDGSETLYYLISGVDPNTSFAGASPVDTSGESYIVTAGQLADLQFVPQNISEVTYYDMQIHAIVVEDDQVLSNFVGTIPEILNQINALQGGAVTTQDFTIVVLPDPSTGIGECEDDQMLPSPILSLIGSGDEDTVIELTLKLTPQAPYYSDLNDLVTLPNGVEGSFGLGIELPEGSSLSSDPPGAVVFDPVTGLWVIDIEKLGVDNSPGGDPTQSSGTLLFTPPEHESSPDPFDADETFGDEDPYDGLNTLNYQSLLINVTCNSVASDTGTFNLVINPVVDGPQVTIRGAGSFDEDTRYDLVVEVTGVDGGERPVGNVEIRFPDDVGINLFDADGNNLTGTIDGSDIVYEIAYDDLVGLNLTVQEHYSGPLDITVSATSEDIDNSTKEVTVTRTIDVIPVADVPEFDPDTSTLDPDTGEPFLEDDGVGTLTINAIEDIPFVIGDFIQADTPDQDGSETISIVLAGVPVFLDVLGPSGSGFIDNGDGSFTISRSAFPQVKLILKDEHARLPDGLDSSLPAEIPLTLTVNTLELGNLDQNSASTNLVFKVRPDADTPSLTATISPGTGIEDQPEPYRLDLQATTPDPHETMEFRITVPASGSILLDGVEQPAIGGVVTIPTVPDPSIPSATAFVFNPVGEVTFLPVQDFGGNVGLDVVAVTIDSSAAFTDTEVSASETLTIDITVSPDLVVDVLDPDVVLLETDFIVRYEPGTDFNISVTDVDGSEVVNLVEYTITDVPDGTFYQIGIGGASVPASGGTLSFSGSLSDFNDLIVTFPANFATNGAPLDGTLRVTTNEGGDETNDFTIEVSGELDLSVSVDVDPDEAPQTGADVTIDMGITAEIDPAGAAEWETIEEVLVLFSSNLPAGTTASAGVVGADRVTLTRGSSTPAEFAALVAALAITLPGSFAGALDGTVTVTTNHGTGSPVPFDFDINDQPVLGDNVEIESTLTSFTIPFSELLANGSDPDTPLSVENPTTNDGDVLASSGLFGVTITVPDGYVGTPELYYDVVDSGAGPARSAATAELDIDTLQMITTGSQITDPDSNVKDLLNNVNGTAGGNDVAKGTSGDDGVLLTLASPYTEIEGFSLKGGSDFIDLSASSRNFEIQLGGGSDWAIAGSGDDVLIGGGGADKLQGGGGNDTFEMTDLATSDEILDYESPIFTVARDVIDLTDLVTVGVGETLDLYVDYNALTGTLTVNSAVAAIVSEDAVNFADTVAVSFVDDNVGGTNQEII